MSRTFQFKQFSIDDSLCGMKVGVDGVLLGAWTQFNKPHNILDVGCGSGLITLQMAQRFPYANLHALDIDGNAIKSTRLNFSNSSFQNKLQLYHSNFLEQDFKSGFDAIICNPPFFAGEQNEDTQRSYAREAVHLPLVAFFEKCLQSLANQGQIALIYPSEKNKEVTHLALQNQLYLHQKCEVYGNYSVNSKRTLYLFGKQIDNPHKETLVIEERRGVYTPEYRKLLVDFYLKF